MRGLSLWGLGTGLVYWLWRYLAPRHSDLILADKVVLITGASSGIGHALALAFARRGTKIILTARNEERLEEVYHDIEPYAAAVHIIPADITDSEQREKLVQAALDKWGVIDIFINNAGISDGRLFVESNPARIEHTIQLNLLAPMLLTYQVLPHMLARGHGTMINIVSTAGRMSLPTYVSYSASKHGLTAFTEGLRRELQGQGVRFMNVLPSWTDTAMVPPALKEQLKERGFEIDSPQAVAEAVVDGWVQGREEVVIGNWLIKLGLYVERFAPFLHRIYWRFALTRGWIEATKQIP